MTAPPVLVIRAQPGASQTANTLVKLGYTPIVSPVLELVGDPEIELPDLETVSGLVFTSANGVRFFADRSAKRDLIAWCVGPATASEARNAGFTTIRESAGNALDLVAFILSNSEPDQSPLLHIANAAAKGDLKTGLEREGRSVLFCPLYRAQHAPALSDEARTVLSSGEPNIVLVHSAKGAEAFLGLADDWSAQSSRIVAISAAAAAAFQTRGVASISVAAGPNEEGLLEALGTVAQV